MYTKPSMTITYCGICNKMEFPNKDCSCTPREKVLFNTRINKRVIHKEN
jgi:hypothetical protein